MRNHKKVKMIRNKFGQVLGYAFWSMFLEYLTEADGNEIEHTEMEWDSFASELGVSATEIKEMIEYCLKIEILFLRLGFLYSSSLDEYLAPVYEKRSKNKQASSTRKRRENGTFSTTLGISAAETSKVNGISDSETPQTKLNKIELKEKLLRQNTIENTEWITKTCESYKLTKEYIASFCNDWISKTILKGTFEEYSALSIQRFMVEDISNIPPIPITADKKRATRPQDLGIIPEQI